MEFNPKKCEHMRITNRHSPIICSYFLDNAVITEVTYTKYLGGESPLSRTIME